jgi:outer membrane protein
MNKISVVFNAVLLVAVAVLFYLFISLNNKISPSTEVAKDSTSKKTTKLVTDPSKLANSKIAYINVDTLSANYGFAVDKSKEVQAQKNALEGTLSSMYAKFQQEYGDLQAAYQAGIRPEAELQKEGERLQLKQGEIANKEKQLENLSAHFADLQFEMMEKVSKFIDKFNDGKYDFILAYSHNVSSILYAKPDLEITTDVVDGLNEEYKLEKAAAAASKKK